MKNLLIILFVAISHLSVYAQGVSLNTAGAPADGSAVLDISSTTKGVLIPRMQAAERTAIPLPAQGLLVFDTDSRSFWFYSNGWNEITSGGGGFSLPYDGSGDEPAKLFSITNTNAAQSTAIYGKRLGGSGLGLSVSNAVWGDNSDGNGVVGTSDSNNGVAGFSNTGPGVSATSLSGSGLTSFSTTGFGISSTSIANFGLASLSSSVDKAGVLGVNNNNTGIGYGVIGSIENPTSGAAIYGKNNATGGHAGLFASTNTANLDPSLKVTTAGNGPAAYFNTTGLGPAGYFVHNNPGNFNPAIFISNSSSGFGLGLSQSAANNAIGIYSLHNGSGKAIQGTSHLGEAGYFDITNSANSSVALTSSNNGTGMAGLFETINTSNDNASLKATTIGTGLAGMFVKNNTSGSISHENDPAVLIDNTSKGNALKVTSMHNPSVNSGIDVLYDGQAFGIHVNSLKNGINAFSQSASGTALVAANYAGGFAIKAYSDISQEGAVNAENSHMFGVGLKGVTTGTQSVAVEGSTNTGLAGVLGSNNAESGVGVKGRTNAFIGYGVRGETGLDSWGIPGQFISHCPDALTNTLWLIDWSKGQTFRIQVNNEENEKEALYVTTEGSGKLASFNGPDGEMFSIANNGNIMVDGTITVKGNKGVVRSSTATQMRIETKTSPTVTHPGLGVGGTVSVNITFATAFSSAPTVTVGNLNSGFVGPCDDLVVCVKNVTTTGCTLQVLNAFMANTGVFNGTWNVVAYGAE